jgi:NADPH2:quinone reductase
MMDRTSNRIVRIAGLGGPEMLQLFDEPPAEPAPGEVRIATGAIGLNRVEVMYRTGGFGMPGLPSRIGYEAAGTVAALGDGVTSVRIGDRVAVLPGLSMERYGTYGESFLYPADRLVPVPDGQSLTEAAASWMQYLTAYAIVAVGKVSAGQTVLINAASSSVGLAAIEIARDHGAIPIAVTRTRAKVQALLDHGAAHVVVTDEEDLAAALARISEGKGIAIAFDAVSGATAATIAGAMAVGGVMIVYGALGGDVMALPGPLVMLHNLTVRGFSTDHLLANPDDRAAAVAYVRDGLARGALRPVIDSTYRLEDIAAAHRHIESNTQFGKIVVTVADDAR